MRIVLDTNVVVSGFAFGGVPGRTLDAWKNSRVVLALSHELLVEYRRVAFELFPARIPELVTMLHEMNTTGVIVEPVTSIHPLCRDHDDDKFLTCAAAAGAILVSGDKDLLAADGVLGVTVLTPRAFLTLLENQS